MGIMSQCIFYVSVFFISGIYCIPVGPVNLEIFNNALRKHIPQALSMALGAAVGDAIWATLALLGISPFLKSPRLEAAFLLGTALITLGLGLVALKDAKYLEEKETNIVLKARRKRISLLKGLTMVLLNPLGIVSWMIALSFLRKTEFFISSNPGYSVTPGHKALFFTVVVLGAFAYFLLIILVTHRMKHFFVPRRTKKVIRIMGFVLLAFSLYFLVLSVKTYVRI